MKITMVKHPRNGNPLAFFSKYEWAGSVARAMFPKYEMTQVIEEVELDPIQDQLVVGLFPWTVTIDVENEETTVNEARSWFNEESVEYFHGPSAIVRTFATTEAEAEAQAVKLWHQFTGQKDVYTHTIWSIDFDEEAQVRSVHRYNSYSLGEIKDDIKTNGNNVTVRVVADTLQDAVEKAGTLYDEWIDKQIMDETE